MKLSFFTCRTDTTPVLVLGLFKGLELIKYWFTLFVVRYRSPGTPVPVTPAPVGLGWVVSGGYAAPGVRKD